MEDLEEQKTLLIGKTNLYDIKMIPQKNNYRLTFYNKPLTYQTTLVNVPFGVEKYAFKEILNLKLLNTDKKNNEYNFLMTIKQLDHFFVNILNQEDSLKIKLPLNLREQLEGKTYMSCLRDNNGFFLRTHLKNTSISHPDKIITIDMLKHKNIVADLELGPLWITKKDYGIILYVTNIKVIT